MQPGESDVWRVAALHDPANVQETSSKCIQNTRANVGRLLEVCWTFVGSCKHPIKLTAGCPKSAVI